MLLSRLQKNPPKRSLKKTELKRPHLGGTTWQYLDTGPPSCITPFQPTYIFGKYNIDPLLWKSVFQNSILKFIFEPIFTVPAFSFEKSNCCKTHLLVFKVICSDLTATKISAPLKSMIFWAKKSFCPKV